MTDTSIVVLDIETTGKERSTDQIIELCLQLGLGPQADRRVWRIKPTVPIHPEAQAVHGITEADLADCKPFGEFASVILSALAAAEVIVGYGVAFDLDILQAELARAGLAPLDLSTKQIVDVLRLWHRVEPRTLAAAHERFCGAQHEGAHAAGMDVAATARVLVAMRAAFGLVGKTWPELAAIADPFPGREKWIGPSNHIQWENGAAVIAFGKHKGTRVDRVDSGFLLWVLRKDFPPHVKDICDLALNKRGDELTAALAQRYPRSA